CSFVNFAFGGIMPLLSVMIILQRPFYNDNYSILVFSKKINSLHKKDAISDWIALNAPQKWQWIK
ncbi:MAG: hypothetical protein ACI4IM_06665, partial [Acutalibacteraceae bacterium]